MPRYKLTLEYDGSSLYGWQRQALGIPTIQHMLEEAIAQFAHADIDVFASGRTDAGVHATGQVAHFDMPHIREAFHVRRGINFYLGESPVMVVNAEQVSDDFHARFSATKRHYIYKIVNRPSALTLDRYRAWHIRKPLDMAAMRQAASHLIGRHDFTSFRDTQCQAASAIRHLDAITITQTQDLITFTVSAKSFLHHQVRNMVGSLVYVGLGKWQPDDMKEVLIARDRTKAGICAPAFGLYFSQVEYGAIDYSRGIIAPENNAARTLHK